MVIKAVDVVLLSFEEMAEQAIGINRQLVEEFGAEIVLDKDKCLPHISLAMGCIDETEIAEVKEVLESIAEKNPIKELKAVSLAVGTNAVGQKVSSFEIEKSKELQKLHEQVMEGMGPYFKYEVSREMIYGSEKEQVAESTLLWIGNYGDKSAFENFWPHITLGYGMIESEISFPIVFDVSKLALCHLGNHCTCRQVFVSVEM